MIQLIMIALLWAAPVSPAFSQTVQACTGGSGSDYGDMTCHIPDCNIATDPTLGCVAVVGVGDAYACYPTTGSAMTSVRKMCNSVTPPSADCWLSNNPGFVAWCASSPEGVVSPSTNRVALTDESDNEPLSCKPLEINFVTQFCTIVNK